MIRHMGGKEAMVLIQKMRELHGFIYENRKYIERKICLRLSMYASKIRIMTIDETLDELEKGKSIARFGDGEMDIIIGKSIGYQDFSAELSRQLISILTQTPDNCLIAVPEAINTFYNLTKASASWWTRYMINNRNQWMNLLNKGYHYGNANVSRCYIRYKDKSKTACWFHRLMNLWKDREVVVIEGTKTRLGCGNSFLGGGT